jgi:outer membrane protein assembly factor BamB
MITKSQVGVTIGFTLAAFFGSQMVGDRLGSAASRSFTDVTSELGSRQDTASDRSGERLNSDGTMLGVNLRRTRVYDAQGLQEPKSILWKTQKLFALRHEETFSGRTGLGSLFGDVKTSHTALSLITTDKESYFSLRIGDGYWFVINLQDGETKKRFKLQNGFFSVPVVAGALLFLGTSDGSFSAFGRHDWKAKWQIGRKGYDFAGSSPAVADGTVYFGGAEDTDQPNMRLKGSVHAVDALTGTEKWTLTNKGISTSVAVADEVIYFGDGDRHLFAVNAKNGQDIWMFTASGNIRTPAIMDGRAFFGDRGGDLYAVDLKNGHAIWKAAKKNKVGSHLAAYNNMIYYSGRENSLHAVDALTGQEKWVYRTKKPCLAPVVANGVIYVASFDNMLLAIDAESGQERWKYKTPHPPYSYPVVGNGVIYYLDEEGVIYALGSS